MHGSVETPLSRRRGTFKSGAAPSPRPERLIWRTSSDIRRSCDLVSSFETRVLGIVTPPSGSGSQPHPIYFNAGADDAYRAYGDACARELHADAHARGVHRVDPLARAHVD